MKEIIKLNKVFAELVDVVATIKENTPSEKKEESNHKKENDKGEMISLTYTIIDKKGATHNFVITPEGIEFRLIYTSIGEYKDYVADDLDLLL